MELRHLRYFVAVAEALNFSRAAAKLRVSQPSLSTQIRDLEKELGFDLFTRTAGRVALTDAGHVFASDAKEILARVNGATQRALDAALGKAGELRIGTVGPVTFALLPAVLRHFHAAHPAISAVVHDIGVRDQLAKLASGEIHVGLMPLDVLDQGHRTQFRVKSLVQCGLGVVLDAHHKVAKGNTVSLLDLTNETFIGLRLAGNDDHLKWMRRICRAAGFSASFGELADSLDNLFSVIAATRGVTLIPKLAKRPLPRGIVFRSLRERELRYELAMVTNPKFASALLTRFSKIAEAEAAALQRRL
ncbi:MAG: hypothetical protein QOH88_2645 [Verrucomicrobiota bacterium]|jgi:DNA-binding transcriptional LysR family regulator